jgi:hypothetical protein
VEKVISEFRVVETDDGFRIEIKGDKEAIRRMLSGFGFHNFFKADAPFGRGFRFGFGPGFWGRFGGWCGPWEEAEEETKTREHKARPEHRQM